MTSVENNLPQPSTSGFQDECDLSGLIENEDDEDDDWMNDVNLEDNINQSIDPTSQLDESAEDFDKNSGNSWIFPIGYEKRDYQLNISQACLFTNTLVCLPTGLGKTFIASVVIYNFYRWFPKSKLIFMAHSRPLVAQQIESCYKVVGIPPNETVELTGKSARDKRMELWNSRRVFFATPQVIQNDLRDPAFPVKSIKLIIVDEAHKAKGKYSYCEVIKEVNAVHQKFRVVALSATPGKTEDVIAILQNLLIARIEVRTENSIDVKKYTFKKDLVVERVKLGGALSEVRDQFTKILDPYLRKLLDHRVINGNIYNKGWVIIQQKKFQMQSHPNKSEITQIFSVAVSLLYSLDVLERHGLQIFLGTFKDDTNKTNLKYFVAQDQSLKEFVNALMEKYKDTSPLALNVNPLPNGEVPSNADKNIYYGHPKYDLLKTKLLEFFNNGGTKSIVFCEFRDTVQLVYTMLLQLRPQILPKMLIGQGGAISQKDQLSVMKDFRSNNVNVLVTTSVCEEGIDVGEVDLVICFDISSKNPTRFVQRIGRTGRKRSGKVIILASEGKEEETVNVVIGSKDKLNKSIHSNKEIQKSLYRSAPRLIPGNFMPKCVETKFNIPEIVEPEVKVKGKKVKKAAGPGISSHFKRVTRSASGEFENVVQTDEVEVLPIIPELITEDSFSSIEKIKSDFKIEVHEKVLPKIVFNEVLVEHIKLCNEQDLKTMDRIMKIFQASDKNDEAFNIELNFESLLDNSVKAEELKPMEVDVTVKDEENIEENFPTESLYGKHFSFFTPVINSPANALMKTPTPNTSSSIFARKSSIKKKRTPIEESPLIKAFEKQRNLSTSTPVTSRTMSRLESLASTSTTLNEFSNRKEILTREERRRTNREMSPLKFFGLTSIDDIFEGLDDIQDEDFIPSSNQPSIIPSSLQSSILPTVTKVSQPHNEDNQISELLEPDDDEVFLNLPMYDDELVESSEVQQEELPPAKEVQANETENDFDFNVDEMFCDSDEPQAADNPKPSTKDKEDDLDFNIDDMFCDDNTKSPKIFDKENSDPKASTSAQNIKTINTAVIVISSPGKNSPKRQRPNISKLIGALKSSNFLQTSPKKIDQVQQKFATQNQPSTSNFKSPLPTNKFLTPKITNFLTPSPVSSRGKKITKNFDHSSDEEHKSSFALQIRKKISKKRKRNEFFDTQAGVDGTDSSDEDEDEELDGFIANDTVDLTQDYDVDITSKYLESLRSPSARQNGNFKIPLQLQPPPKDMMIFSQAVEEEDDDDYDESFVVPNDADHTMDQTVDELEIAERKLKEKRRKAKALKNGIKRRKIVRPTESSDEDDELKRLREETD